jgi:hypothetical protein
MSDRTLSTPDLTPMQLIVGAVSGVITAVVTLVNVFGWAAIDAVETAALLGVWAALGSVLVLADAIIRNGRSRALQGPPPARTEDTIAG